MFKVIEKISLTEVFVFVFKILSLHIFHIKEAARAVSPVFPQVWFALKQQPAKQTQLCCNRDGHRDTGPPLSRARLFYRDGLFSMVMSRENVPAFNKFPVNEYILSCPKLVSGFPIPSYRKTQMNFLANPRYQVPSRADAGMEAKEDRQGFCSFGMILSTT